MKLDNRYITSYKKNSFAIILSISMTIALIFCVLSVKDTDDHMEALRYEYLCGAQDFELKDLSFGQVEKLQTNKDFKYLGISYSKDYIKGNEQQGAFMYSSNKDYILANSKLLEGRLPKSADEFVAEEWVLKNMSINPEIGKMCTMDAVMGSAKKTWIEKRKYRLVGVISDNPENKTNSHLIMHSGYAKDSEFDGEIYARIKVKSGIDAKQELKEVRKSFNIKKKNSMMNTYRENPDDLYKIDHTRLILLIALLVISAIIILGIYRICILSRTNQYGILRAIGMKKGKLFRLILSELFKLYIVSIPIGFGLGFIFTNLMSLCSKDSTTKIVLWGKDVKIQYIIPFYQIGLFALGLGALMVFIAIYSYRYATKESIVKTITKKGAGKSSRFQLISIKSKLGLIKPYKKVGIKYLLRDKMETLFVVLSITIGCTMLIGLYQKAIWDNECNTYGQRQYYNNTDFKLEKMQDGKCKIGISEAILKKAEKIEGVQDVSAAMNMQVRVVDNGEVKRNKPFFKMLADYTDDTYFKGYRGNDGTDSFYKTILQGFNETGLKKLHQYLDEGNFNPSDMKKDEVILWIPKAIDSKSPYAANGYSKNGVKALDYHIGDSITMKYRSDFKTDSLKFMKGEDKGAAYTSHTFKIGAIVYFPYLSYTDVDASGHYPSVIMSDKQYKDLFHLNVYSTINIDAKMPTSAQALNKIESELNVLALRNRAAIYKNIRNERISMDNMIQKQNIYCIGIVIIVLLISFMNLLNNLKYRMDTRKQEISIYRAIGMNAHIVDRMIQFENIIIGITSLVLTSVASYHFTKYLYSKSNANYFGIKYQYDFIVFAVISVVVIAVICILSKVFAKKMCQENIIEGITDVE